MSETAKLRVFVDGSILKPRQGGIATYIAELTAAVARCPGVQVAIATSTPRALALPASVEIVELPAAVQRFGRRMIWRERNLGALLARWDAGVLLAPMVELPLRRLSVPSIMVVHDLGPVQAPELYGRLRWARHAAGIPLACRRADEIVCVSHATLTALRETFPWCAKKGTVIGEAGRAIPARTRRPRRPPCVLAVGTLLPHKNIDTLVRAMNEPALRHVELILAGPADGRELGRLEVWRRAVVEPSRIRHEGFVDLDRLADLYAGASAVALPSLYEGFGLTLLEAMKCGTPAVASAIPAHREVGGDTVIYVDAARNPTAWADALAMLTDDEMRANALARAASARAASVTWDAIAEQMVALARRALARPAA